MIEFDKTEKEMSKSRALAHYFRRMILEGRMKPGEMLPSTQLLAKELDMSPANVQRALSTLVHEQIIERKPHLGTVVKTVEHSLKMVAVIIFVRADMRTGFYQNTLCCEITHEMQKRGCSVITLQEDVDHFDIRQLEEKLQLLHVQAVIPFDAPAKVILRFKNINLPIATTSGVFKDNGVYPAVTELPELAEKILIKEHCRRPGFISSTNYDPEKFHYALATNRMLNNTLNLLKKYSPDDGECLLQMCPKLPEDFFAYDCRTEFAYNSAKKLLEMKNPVDSLIVYTDELCHGVMQAVLESGKRPLLIFYKNKELDYFYPVKPYFLEVSVREIALSLIKILFRQFNGEQTKKEIIHFRITDPENLKYKGGKNE